MGLGPVMLGTQHPCWEGEKGTTTRGQRLPGVSCFVGGHMLFWGPGWLLKFSGVTFVVHLFHPWSKIRGVPRFARARGSWLWSVTSSSWILSGSNRTPPQFAGAVEMCWEEAPGRQTATQRPTPPAGTGLLLSHWPRWLCHLYPACWRAGRRPSHRECTRPPTFQCEGTKPSAQRRQQRQGVPAATQVLCHQGAEVKMKLGSDFSRCFQWWCLSTCWKQKVLSHSVVSTCPWTGQPGSRVQWGC